MWSDFQKRPESANQKMERERKKAGMRGIGNPQQLIENFRALEDAGVDQLILLHQCGAYRHEDICNSLKLFAAEVLPEFKAREAARAPAREAELAPFIAAAQERVPATPPLVNVPPVEAYPLSWKKMSPTPTHDIPDRRPGMTAFWQMQIGGKRQKK
jgi:hypothetical protein